MKRLKWIIPIAVVLLLAAAVAGFFAGKDFSTGYCVVADNNSRLIVQGNSPIRLSNGSRNEDMLYKFDTGDKLLVLHDGIQETYPGSTRAYFCMKIGEGSAADIPDEVFTGLHELGWLSSAYLEEIGIIPPTIVTTPDIEADGFDAPSYAFTAQYTRTDGIGEDAQFPSVTVLNTYEELTAYIEANRELFDLESEFIPAVARYDEGYFLRQNLVLIRLEESSGSIRHEITDVRRNSLGRWQLSLDRVTPVEQTDDMAQWHILLEVQMGKVITEADSVNLLFDSFTPVTVNTGPYIMTLNIPEGWEFEEDSSDDFRQGLRFRPQGETEGWVGLYYHTHGFSVCGTGLEEHELRLTHGFKGRIGYYDGNPLWSYITIDDANDYVFINDGAAWLGKYSDEVFGIVASVDPTMIVTCVAPE